MLRLFVLFPILFCCTVLAAQSPQDLAVPLEVAAGVNPPAVLLSWPNPNVADIQLRRRLKGQPGDAWTVLVDETATFRNGYYDVIGLAAAESYEYALERKTGPLRAYGYAYAALQAPVVDTRGKILVFIDSLTADQLGADLIAFKNDLRGEGWQIVPVKTGNHTTVQGVKNKIINAYAADPTQVKAVLLIGSVPVPYSGSQAWDGQADHAGAWPCDAYYGDIDGEWTDVAVNLPNTARAANRNVPGDGKFDQNTLPSAIELPVGRLDFRHLSATLFGLPPVELLRRYLLKNHRWRTGQFETPHRALVDDELGWSGGAAFAAAGFRNAYPLVGENQVVTSDFLTPANERYLLGFGAGADGTYTSAGGIGSAADFATDSVHTVFANFSGHYFGDWDYESNPLLPAALASKGSLLACSWAGNSDWLLHGLAVGETVGYCLRETQNAQYNEAYDHNPQESGIHLALLGDPTLRAKIVKPATQLTAMSNCTQVNLRWTASPETGVFGYLVYRAFDGNGPYTRLTPNAITGTEWSDLAPVADTLFYSVRAIKLETTPGGGHFYNSGTGIVQSVIFQPGTLPTIIGLGGVLNCQVSSLTLGAHFQPPGANIRWFKPDGSALNGFTATRGGVYQVVVTAFNGCTAAAYATVEVDTLLPQLDLPGMVTLDCAHPTALYTVPDTTNGLHYTWNGMPVFPGEVISLSMSAVFTVSSSVNGCSRAYMVSVAQDFSPPEAVAGSDGNALDCTHSFVQLSGNSNVADAHYAWSGNGSEVSFVQNPIVTTAGEYCLTVTTPNGCSATDCIPVEETGETVAVQIFSSGGPCNLGSNVSLGASIISGTAPFQYSWSNGATTTNVDLPPGFSGPLDLTLTDAHGCVGTASYFVAPPVTIFALKSNESASGAADGYIDLEVGGGVPPYSYQWSNGETTQDIDSLTSGVYTVICTDAAGCSASLAIPIMATVGTNALAVAHGLRIFPNPATEAVGIYFREKEAAVIRLTDLAGRLVATRVGEESVFFLPTSSLHSGTYVLWVELPAGRMQYRLVVAH